MCGIAGLVQMTGNQSNLNEHARMMSDQVLHRGPDDAGIWVDTSAGLAFSHRRLAIQDLSPEGHQPMTSASGRLIICFNGEIYNHLDMRSELEAMGETPKWRGHSDTETLIAAIETWGVEGTLRRANGMFAFALWDKTDRTLYLARDRFGEKPLFYGWCAGHFAFGSSLASFRALPNFDNRISRAAVAQYMRVMYVPAPFSIFEGIFKLEPGCILRLKTETVPSAPDHPLRAGDALDPGLSIRRWWSLSDEASDGANSTINDPQAALDTLQTSLLNATRRQSIADVPVGAFLSGGIDSSLITALMQAGSMQPVRTFTIGFEDAEYDESADAAAVAKHLGTIHTKTTVTSQDARAVIPDLADIYDEPFADSSQIPTYLVCRSAKSHVTVALSGDAGDELFGGYNRYLFAPRIWNKVSRIPSPIRNGLAKTITTIPPPAFDALGKLIRRNERREARLGEKLHKLGSRIDGAQTFDEFYCNLVSEWPSAQAVIADLARDTPELPLALQDPVPIEIAKNVVAKMMFQDALTYLPDDILCKVDRAAMACSLETRVPFLDIDVVRSASRLPMSMKIDTGIGKGALRKLLYTYVPQELIDRPKTGFAIPVGQWLRGPLREWADDHLTQERLERHGLFKPEPILDAWQDHCLGRKDSTAKIWSILMLQCWIEKNGL